MLKNKIKSSFKRRRPNKIRYTANKIYLSRAELKHTNNKLTIMLYVYNKHKLSIQHLIKKLAIVGLKKKIMTKKGMKKITIYKNRIIHLLNEKFYNFKEWNILYFKIAGNFFKNKLLKSRHRYTYNIPFHNALVKKYSILKPFNYIQSINFNELKFNDIWLNFGNLGLISMIEKLYNKKVEIQWVELKSIHLNSDIFSSAVALKLRDRQNKAIRILRKAVIYMVKIPDLHTLITFDDNIQTISKNNILNTIKQQVVSGVRFEASGRLTKRLTAMRAIFKYRYVGGLKNIRSSYNGKASAILRGHVKANAQYTLINSKTRNGTFGLKGWVSSH